MMIFPVGISDASVAMGIGNYYYKYSLNSKNIISLHYCIFFLLKILLDFLFDIHILRYNESICKV